MYGTHSCVFKLHNEVVISYQILFRASNVDAVILQHIHYKIVIYDIYWHGTEKTINPADKFLNIFYICLDSVKTNTGSLFSTY